MKRNGKVEVQLRGRGNDRWKPRAILIIYDAAGGGSELRIGLDRNWSVKVFWVLWWLVWIWNAAPRPFVWTKSADEILATLAGYLQRISGTGR